jgi:hypothetical protein
MKYKKNNIAANQKFLKNHAWNAGKNGNMVGIAVLL